MDIQHEIELDPTARIRALQPEEVRRRSALMEKVRATYGSSKRDADLGVHFDELWEDLSERRDDEAPHARENRLEGNQMIVVGESGAGKTTALGRMFRRHPALAGYGVPGSGCPVVTIAAPSPCTLAELGRETLFRLGYQLRRSRVEAPEVWRIVREQLRGQHLLALHFDELQHVVQTVNADELQKVRNNLKGLLVDPEHPVALVLSGTWEMLPLLQPDRQVARRGRWIEFQRLVAGVDDDFVLRFVKALANVAELRFDEDQDPELVRRLMHAGVYQVGVTAEEIHDAVRLCLRLCDPVLRQSHFADAFARRTGNLAPWNPYLAEDCLAVDATRVLATAPEKQDEATPPKPRAGKRSSPGKGARA